MTKQNRKSFRRVHPIRRRTSSRRRLLVEQLESRHLLAAVPFGAEPADGSEYMLGDVYVTVVFLESDGSIDPNLENWTSAQKEEVKQKIRDGLAWWEDVLDLQGSTHDLNFVVDFTHADTPVETPYEPLTRSNGDSNLWIQKFLDGEGFDSSSDYASNLEHFNHAQRLAAQTHWAFTIFIVNSANDADGLFANGVPAFASSRGFVVMQQHRTAGTVAHEVGHVFYALDEYSGGRSYFDRRGYYNTQNLNGYEDHPNPALRVPSIMGGNGGNPFADHQCSQSCLEMIGWKDSDGDGIFDVLDVPLVLKGSGAFNPATNQYEFEGESWVEMLPNLNPGGSGNDITLNTVSRVQYRLDGGIWVDARVLGGYRTPIDFSIGPLPSGDHVVEIRTVADESGVASNVFRGITEFPTATAQPGINGFAWSDVNSNGIWNAGDPGLEGVVVSLKDQAGQIVSQVYAVEPDDYDHRQLISTVIPEVTLTAFGSGVGEDAVYAWDVGGVATGTKVFVHRLGNGAWNTTWRDTRRLRADFDFPVRTVSLDVISPFSGGQASLAAYSTDGTLLDTYTTQRLSQDDVETMTVSRGQADIAYVITDGDPSRSSIRLDNLRFSIDATAQTNRFGAFSFANLETGSYVATATHPLGIAPTSPSTSQRSVSIGAEQTVSGIDFGFAAPALTLTVNQSQVSENAGADAVTATVRRTNASSLASPLVVTLSNSDVTELSVPVTVTIPANVDQVSFPVDAVDDTILDGPQAVTIAVAASGFSSHGRTLQVNDRETLEVTFDVPSISENDGNAAAIGTIRRGNTDIAAPLTVILNSDDSSELKVPGSVTIAAGRSSATFLVDAADDSLLDGTQNVAVTASAEGYVPGTGALAVLDHETLTVVIAADVVDENAGPSATTATISRSNTDIANALTVNLSSDDPTELTVTTTMEIPAGQSFVQVPVNAVDDSLRDDLQTVHVTASASGYASGSDVVLVRHVNHAPVLELSSPQLGTVEEDESFAAAINTFVTGIDERDLGDSVGGIAVLSAHGIGTWYFSTGGQAFAVMTAVDEDSALLLPPDARVRFVPATDNGEVASLTYRAWDATSGSPGGRADARNHGGISPFSAAIDTASLTVGNKNDAPTSITINGLSVVENQPGAVIGTVFVSDPDADDTHTFTISDDRFEVVNAQLKLKPDKLLDHEIDSTIEIDLTATDDGSPPLGLTQSFVISVFDVNEFAPALRLATLSVNENAANGTLVGTLQATDADASQTVQFELVGASAFSIDSASGEIRVTDTTQLDHEASAQLSISVKVTDNGTPAMSTTVDVSIAINDVNEFTPMIVESLLRIAENAPNGTSVGLVSGVDQDVRQHLSYRITGASIANAFTIVADTGELIVNDETLLDHEARTEVSLIVEVQDSGSPPRSSTAVITIEIEDANEFSPSIEDQSFTIDENSPAGVSVGLVRAHDQDRSQILRYAILATAVNEAFTLNSATGEIVVNTAQLDHETTPRHQLIIEVADDGVPIRSQLATVTIDVRDLNEFPPTVSSQGFAIDENSSNGTVVGRVFASDADTSQALSYAIAAGNADGAFAIDESTGELTVADNSQLDYEITPQRSIQVTVTDSGSPARSATGTIVVGVSDVNEAPQVDSQLVDQAIGANVLFDFELPENAFVDPDAGDSLRYAAQLADGSKLPNWLSFDTSRRQFSGAASDAGVGMLELRVTASDHGTPALTASQSFQLAINSNPFPWHHAANPRDVNRDGTIAPVDVLIVINEVNSPKISQVGGRLPLPYNPSLFPFDVNADGSVTPIDALIVINYLNQAVTEHEFSFVAERVQGLELQFETRHRENDVVAQIRPLAIATPRFGVIPTTQHTPSTPLINRSKAKVEDRIDESWLEELAFDVAASCRDGLHYRRR
jgi:hypothetical protein